MRSASPKIRPSRQNGRHTLSPRKVSGGVSVRTGFRIGLSDAGQPTPADFINTNVGTASFSGAFAQGGLPLDLSDWLEKFRGTRAAYLERTEGAKENELDLSRFWELDAGRGLAVGMMVALHLLNGWGKALSPTIAKILMDIWTPIKNIALCVPVTFWLGSALLESSSFNDLVESLAPGLAAEYRAILAYATVFPLSLWIAVSGFGASAFLFLTGLSMAVKAARSRDAQLLQHDWVNRGLNLFGWGVVLTTLSFWIAPEAPIYFGILHLLGMVNLVAIPMFTLAAPVSAAAGVFIFTVGQLVISRLHVNSIAWLWLGLSPVGMGTFDYVPIFPYMGIALLGMAAGRALYKEGFNRSYKLPDLSRQPIIQALSKLGRVSLPVYLAQMPLALSGFTAAAG